MLAWCCTEYSSATGLGSGNSHWFGELVAAEEAGWALLGRWPGGMVCISYVAGERARCCLFVVGMLVRGWWEESLPIFSANGILSQHYQVTALMTLHFLPRICVWSKLWLGRLLPAVKLSKNWARKWDIYYNGISAVFDTIDIDSLTLWKKYVQS